MLRIVMANAKRESPPSRFSEYQRSATGALLRGSPCVRLCLLSNLLSKPLSKAKDTAKSFRVVFTGGRPDAVACAENDRVSARRHLDDLFALAGFVAPAELDIEQFVRGGLANAEM